MNVDLIFKIAGLGILVAVLGQILTRSGREEMAMLTTLAGLALALTVVIHLIGDLFGSVRAVFGLT